MILSHRHKFIFIKVQKTAGTSVEMALAPHCGPEDIVTPLSKKDERKRAEAGIHPRNYEAPWWTYGPKDVWKRLRGWKKRTFYNHMTAAEVRRLVGPEIWDDYYTFCFDRNPWDKVVSMYYWQNQNPDTAVTFETFVEKRKLPVEHGHYANADGEVIVDFVGRYEHLRQDLKQVADRLGLDLGEHLPRAKAGVRPASEHYSRLYTPKLEQRIADAFTEEIRLHGYAFERPTT